MNWRYHGKVILWVTKMGNIMKVLAFLTIFFVNKPTIAIPVPSAGIPAGLVSIHSQNPLHAIVVEKRTQKLFLYESSNAQYRLVKSFQVATGQVIGTKITQGDKRTPEGIYFFTKELGNGSLLPKHGKRAFVLNYPNVFDQRARKTGNGIWLHGTDQPERIVTGFATEGCVALRNEELDQLTQYIQLGETPILIYDVVPLVNSEDLQVKQQQVHQLLNAWKSSWEKEDIEKYMGFYSRNSFNSNHMNWKRWKTYKESLAQQYANISVEIKGLKILDHKDQMLVSFVQHYSSDLHEDRGEKWMYFEREGNEWKIIAEDWRPEHEGSP